MRIRFVRTILFALVLLCMSAASFSQIGVMITIAPPAIPVYEQPICPADGYIWTPGYWAYGDDFDDYYWVPGTWVEAPEVGFLWTPGYWGWGGDRFVFTEGYWGPEVGFYGGINYGFGYFGNGYEGGRWDHDHFFYNRAVTHVNVTIIHNVYETKVVERNTVRTSYNGGNGGINVRATSEQESAARGRHIAPVTVQTQHAQAARSNNQQRASVNRGKPEIAATAKPGEFTGHDVARAKKAGAPYTPPANRGNQARDNQPRENSPAPRPENNNNNAARSNSPVHPSDIPAAERTSPNTGNGKLDKKYQQQQEKQSAKQDQERQKLQQRQEKEHQQLEKQNADAARKQQVEQKHQQQTQQLQQRHAQQQQKLQTRQQPAAPKGQPKR